MFAAAGSHWCRRWEPDALSEIVRHANQIKLWFCFFMRMKSFSSVLFPLLRGRGHHARGRYLLLVVAEGSAEGGQFRGVEPAVAVVVVLLQEFLTLPRHRGPTRP